MPHASECRGCGDDLGRCERPDCTLEIDHLSAGLCTWCVQHGEDERRERFAASLGLDVVTVRQGADGWREAIYSGPHAASIRSLFGTDTLPLPYANTMSSDVVVTLLRSRAPEVAYAAID